MHIPRCARPGNRSWIVAELAWFFQNIGQIRHTHRMNSLKESDAIRRAGFPTRFFAKVYDLMEPRRNRWTATLSIRAVARNTRVKRLQRKDQGALTRYSG